MSLNTTDFRKNYNPRSLPDSILKEPKKPRVLLIEDDRTTRRMVRASVKEDCHLTIAGNANLGVSVYRNFQPDIVFMDIQLPDGNGHQLLQWIMSINPNAFVVMFSGMSDSNTLFRSVDAGAKGFISKPFNEQKMRFFIEQSTKHQQ